MSRKVAVLGAGPIGLEAALAAQQAGHEVVVFERGEVAQNVAEWGFIRLFSPWSMNVTPAGREAMGLDIDPQACPTGDEFRRRYLLPLASRLDVRTHSQVRDISRQDLAKYDAIGQATERAASPFRLLVQDQAGERVELADVVIDSTGTYGTDTARPLGRGGMLAPGEREAAEAGKVRYTLPDVLGRDREQYAGKHTLVVGCGYSAASVLWALGELAEEAPGTRATWVIRRVGAALHRIDQDPLMSRARLVVSMLGLVQAPPAWLSHRPGRQVESLRAGRAGVTVELSVTRGGLGEQIEVDQVVGLVGYAPDDSLWRHLQVHQCYATFGPMKTAAALLGEGSGDCLTAGSSLGSETLVNPEPNFFVLGAKSYGTNSAFLLSAGHRQVPQAIQLT